MQDVAHFVSVPRFSKMVSLSERTCWSLISGGLIPVHRIGRRVLIRPKEGFEALEQLAIRHPSARRRARRPRRVRSRVGPSES